MHTESVERHLSRQQLSGQLEPVQHGDASEEMMRKITASYLQHGEKRQHKFLQPCL